MDVKPEDIRQELDQLLAQAEDLVRRIRALQRRLDEEAPEAPPSGTPPDSTVAAWLQRRGVTLVHAEQDHGERWEVLDPLVKQMAQWYATTPPLRDLLAAVRRHQATGDPFTLNLSRCAPEEISRVTNIATRLHRLALLPRYAYRRETKRLQADPPAGGAAIRFLTGEWFERYVYLETTAALRTRGLSWDALFNIQVRLPSGQETELDLLILPAGWPHPIWLEAKSGDYRSFLGRCQDIRRALGLPVSASLLVILGLPAEDALGLSDLHNVTVINEMQVREAVGQLLDGETVYDARPDPDGVRRLLQRHG